MHISIHKLIWPFTLFPSAHIVLHVHISSQFLPFKFSACVLSCNVKIKWLLPRNSAKKVLTAIKFLVTIHQHTWQELTPCKYLQFLFLLTTDDLLVCFLRSVVYKRKLLNSVTQSGTFYEMSEENQPLLSAELRGQHTFIFSITIF